MDYGKIVVNLQLLLYTVQFFCPALEIGMDQSQYSKIEKGKTDPYTSTLDKIAKALGMTMAELFSSENIFREVNSQDKTLMEKLWLVEMLEEDERKSVYNIIDGLFAKKKLKDTLSDALGSAG